MSNQVITEVKAITDTPASDLVSVSMSEKLGSTESGQSSLHKKFWIRRTFGSIEKTSVSMSILTLLNTAIGTGMLALPQAIGNFGFISGALMLIVGATNLALGLYCFLFLIFKFPNSQIYSQLVDNLLGSRWASFTNLIFLFHVWCSLVAYILVGKLKSAQTVDQFVVTGCWINTRRI